MKTSFLPIVFVLIIQSCTPTPPPAPAATTYHPMDLSIPNFTNANGYQQQKTMDLKTHAYSFAASQAATITKLGYQPWVAGITYKLALWQAGNTTPLATITVTPSTIGVMQFFPLPTPVTVTTGNTYLVSRMYMSGGPTGYTSDFVGNVANMNGNPVYPYTQQAITFTNGYFTDNFDPLLTGSNTVNAPNNTLLPFLDVEYQ